jgi:hypothetical protein
MVPPFGCPVSAKKGRVKAMPGTKIEFSCNKIARIKDLDELAALLFPGSRDQQKVFLAIFIELKYARGQFIPYLRPLCEKCDFTPRILETVRSKMRRMGLIDHVSRFNKTHGYREGWVFSSRFSRSLSRLSKMTQGFRERKDAQQERKDRDLFRYL